MKILTISICSLIITTFSLFSQSGSNLTVFSEDGSKFYLILNGIRQNDVAQTNIKVSDLSLPSYQARILFIQEKTDRILQI